MVLLWGFQWYNGADTWVRIHLTSSSVSSEQIQVNMLQICLYNHWKKGMLTPLFFEHLSLQSVESAGGSFVRAGTRTAVPAPWESHGKVGALLCIAKKDHSSMISQTIRSSLSEGDLAHSQFALSSHCVRPISIKSTVLWLGYASWSRGFILLIPICWLWIYLLNSQF